MSVALNQIFGLHNAVVYIIIIIIIIIIITALQLLLQRYGLLNQFLPSSSILHKGSPIWHY
jgi:hypothetical protein